MSRYQSFISLFLRPVAACQLLLVITLLQGCATVSPCPDCDPLESAIMNSDYTLVKQLLAEEMNVNRPLADGKTLLHYAAMKKDADITRLLIDNGAKIDMIDNAGYTPLLTAIKYGSEEIALLLIQLGADGKSNNPKRGFDSLTNSAAIILD